MTTRLLAASLAALTLATIPSTADACWDGVAISTERVTLAVPGDDTWSPEDARRWAKWAGRIDALVPAGKTLSVTFGYVEICDDATGDCTEAEQTWDNDDPFTLFELTADVLGASRKEIAHARRSAATPLTVQVAASNDLDAATKLAERINEAGLGLTGFLDVGGFPAFNAYAHVVESTGTETTAYQVVVGAFLHRDAATAAVVELEKELGMTGFVRVLDQSSVSPDEGC
jgi:hypothetical protein